MTFGSLFAGIGGIDLGLERAGMKCIWQVENNPYAIKVLEKHWPDVHREKDVRECGAHNLEKVDLICGGFPCQDLSVAGKRAGIKGKRSGLWFEMCRIVRELQPCYVLVENVPGLLSLGMGRVLGDLAESGYDAEWNRVSAASVGAPHLRERIFIVAWIKTNTPCANANGKQSHRTGINEFGKTKLRDQQDGIIGSLGEEMVNPDGNGQFTSEVPKGSKTGSDSSKTGQIETSESSRSSEQYQDVADPGGSKSGRLPDFGGKENTKIGDGGQDVADTCVNRLEGNIYTEDSPAAGYRIFKGGSLTRRISETGSMHWTAEPDVGRVAHGISHRVDRLKCLGNAVVPQVAEFIGKLIAEYATESNKTER